VTAYKPICKRGHVRTGSERCRKCAVLSTQKYKRLKLFGGNREAAILRDGEKCVKCGMTREEHRERFNRDITVDHIDGRGCNVPVHMKNNELSNLQTLCMPCHTRKDTVTIRLSNSQVQEIRDLKGKYTSMELAKVYGVSKHHIRGIWQRKQRKTWIIT
jgi:hypothetical protein